MKLKAVEVASSPPLPHAEQAQRSAPVGNTTATNLSALDQKLQAFYHFTGGHSPEEIADVSGLTMYQVQSLISDLEQL